MATVSWLAYSTPWERDGWRAGVVVGVVRSRSFGVFGVDDGYINETRDCCAVTCGAVGGATSGKFTTTTH
jgi:hypothetical protein